MFKKELCYFISHLYFKIKMFKKKLCSVLIVSSTKLRECRLDSSKKVFAERLSVVEERYDFGAARNKIKYFF